MMKRYLCALLAALLMMGCALAEQPLIDRQVDQESPWPFAEGAELMEIWFPRMTDCDAAVIRQGSKVWLIDCGSDKFADRLLFLLDALEITEIEGVYISHPHHDHTNGFLHLTDKYTIGSLNVGFPLDYNEVMVNAVAAAQAADIPVNLFASGDVIALGDAELEIYMTGRTDWNLNNQSAMMWLRYGKATMLFTADLELRAQKYIAENLPAEKLKADVLKFPHHGLEKISRFFGDAVDPAYSVVTSNGRVYEVKYDLGFRKVGFNMTMSGITRLTTDGETWVAEVFQEDDLQSP